MTTLRRRLLVMVCVTVAVLAMAGPAGARSARIRTSAHTSGGSATAPRTVGAASAVLYDQNNNDAGNDITSQNFQPALDFLDDQAADDFTIPSSQVWSIDTVSVTGTYGGTPGPADSVNVFFYNDASTLPGALVAEYDGVAPSAGLATASFVLPLSPPVSLTDGTYWVSVQTNQDSSTNGQWLWEIRSVQSGNGAAWQNPGGGFGTGCTSWGRESTCIPGTGPDQMFSLSGTAAACTISGDGLITGTAGPDVICGGPGNDTINGLGGGDTIYGLAGNDALLGKAGPDTLVGGPGSDFLKGGYGNDHLDAVDGVSGNDTGTGGRGFDTCTKDAGDTLSSCEA